MSTPTEGLLAQLHVGVQAVQGGFARRSERSVLLVRSGREEALGPGHHAHADTTQGDEEQRPFELRLAAGPVDNRQTQPGQDAQGEADHRQRASRLFACD